MVITNNVHLPDCSELNVQEVDLSSPVLLAAGPYLGKDCENINNEFMLCRFESGDPRACLGLGKLVTTCTLQFFQKVKRACFHEFNQYANCVDKSSGDLSFKHCRKTQAVFEECMDEKLCMKRPEFGYFCRARVHKTSRPPPPANPCPCQPVVPDPTPSLPDCKPRQHPRFGSRFYWMTE
ncbi:NADH dehydrogenase [ubiquinone] 1 alpha subcomplex subunit 8-like [Leptidea sinapis]|uniref:NADH dehydrogenase [ubiquinone] 1 alpha subcomplex subunit 8 n=1 Tax=Leptidea sinapis TaxID=189913 RepID=A0A5E4Q2T4_9NEOP|nr:NADH dehydrogenase [ubiquinone] 1 alpha subcomplex subunit 8-like [Leptidea sinapis]VVC91544.1 unnamed protein product [Leptidea sinapis]